MLAAVSYQLALQVLVVIGEQFLEPQDFAIANCVLDGDCEWTLEQWDKIIATNLTANFLLAHAAEPYLRQAKGAMVLMSSSRAQMSEPGTFAYSASKGGIVALTHSLAISLQPDVRVNCVLPGWIDTGKHGPIEQADHDQHPAGRVGRPEDIAEMVSFLLSEEKAGFITGQEFTVDGGMTKKMIYV